MIARNTASRPRGDTVARPRAVRVRGGTAGTGFPVRRCAAFAIVVCATVFAAAGAACGADVLTLNTPGEPPWHFPDQSGIIDRWMQQVFAEVRLKVVMQKLPSERALVNANDGIEDGDAIRIGGLAAAYPNLIQVPEKVAAMEFVAFTKRVDVRIDGWDSLRPYHVGIIKGHKIAEANVKGTHSLVAAVDAEQLFTLLEAGRIDIAIDQREMGVYYLMHHGIENVRLLKLPLGMLDFFLYLNRRHEALVPGVAAAIRKLREDGTFERSKSAFFAAEKR